MRSGSGKRFPTLKSFPFNDMTNVIALEAMSLWYCPRHRAQHVILASWGQQLVY